jgi:hypothetical protein
MPALAQRHALEISPFAGYRWDGTLEGDNGLFLDSVDIDQSEVYGLRLDFPVTDAFQIELQASHQPTRFSHGDQLFGQHSDFPDVDVDTFHVGFLFQGGDGQVHPYGIFSVGATRLSPDVAHADSVSRLSTSGGGGLKVFFGPHVGMRFEGRIYWTDTDQSNDWWDDHDLWQKEATAGLILAF